VVSWRVSSCTALAAPGLISDTAPTRWTGEATSKTAAIAARPKTFVPFISYLLLAEITTAPYGL
jgi:hypothetical protein